MKALGRLGASLFAPLGVFVGVVWKGTEFAHTIEYLKKIVAEHFLPSVGLILLACVWIIIHRQRKARGKPLARPDLRDSERPVPTAFLPPIETQPAPPPVVSSSFDEVIVKERIIEREVVFRKWI